MSAEAIRADEARRRALAHESAGTLVEGSGEAIAPRQMRRRTVIVTRRRIELPVMARGSGYWYPMTGVAWWAPLAALDRAQLVLLEQGRELEAWMRDDRHVMMTGKAPLPFYCALHLVMERDRAREAAERPRTAQVVVSPLL